MNAFANFNMHIFNSLNILGYLYHLNITDFTTFELQILFQFYVLIDCKEPLEKLNINRERF